MHAYIVAQQFTCMRSHLDEGVLRRQADRSTLHLLARSKFCMLPSSTPLAIAAATAPILRMNMVVASESSVHVIADGFYIYVFFLKQ